MIFMDKCRSNTMKNKIILLVMQIVIWLEREDQQNGQVSNNKNGGYYKILLQIKYPYALSIASY